MPYLESAIISDLKDEWIDRSPFLHLDYHNLKLIFKNTIH